MDYALYDILPKDLKKATPVNKAIKLYYDAVLQIIYSKSYDDILLRCLLKKEAQEVLKETHDECGAQQPEPKL